MKLGICCNFGPPHCGGSETVIKHVSTKLIQNLGYEITVFGFNYNKNSVFEGMNLVPCQKGENFVSQINEMDHIFVYSDSFWEWETILRNIDRIKPDVSIAMVGMYHMIAHSEAYKLFRDNINRYRIITHSKGNDYKKCVSDGLEVNIVPNGVDLAEFEENTINFREKYNIREKYIFLVVANHFFGKNQSTISAVCHRANRDNNYISDSCAFVFVYNTVKYKYADRLLYNCKKVMEPYNSHFFQDLPREDVVSAFKCSDALITISGKEVAPLVILESQAAGLPWVSMDVGDVENRKGGIIIHNSGVDIKGYKIITPNVINEYILSLESIVINKEMNSKLIRDGQKDIKKYDWLNIVPLYNEVFRG